MESTKKTKLTALIFSLLFICITLFGFIPSVHAEEATIQSMSLTVRATTLDENIIYPSEVTVAYSKFSDLGISVVDDDPGFMTPLHVLAAYYQTKGATKDTMKDYIQVNPDGSLKAIKKTNGQMTNVSDTTKWLVAQAGNMPFLNEDGKTPVNALAEINLSSERFLTGIGFYAYDSSATAAYVNWQNQDTMAAVTKSTNNYLNRKLALTEDEVNLDAVVNAAVPVMYKEVDGRIETATVGDETADYQLTGDENSYTKRFVFNKAGVYYLSIENPVDADGKSINTTRPLEKFVVYTEAEYNFRQDVINVNFNSGKTEFYQEENTWTGSKYSPIYNGRNGSTVEWVSSNPERLELIKAADGSEVMTIKAHREGLTEDMPITVKAVVKNGDFTETKEWQCNLIADAEKFCFEKDRNAGSISSTTIYQNSSIRYTAPTYGSNLEYSTSDETHLSLAIKSATMVGVTVNRSGLLTDTPIKIYAKVTQGKYSQTNEQEVTVFASTDLNGLSLGNVGVFQFEPGKYSYSAYYKEGTTEIPVHIGEPEALALKDSYKVTVNGELAEWNGDYTFKLDPEKDINALKVRVERDGYKYDCSEYTINLSQDKEITPLPDYTAFWGTGHRDDYNLRTVSALTPRSIDEVDKDKSWSSAVSHVGGSGMSGWGKWSYPIIVDDKIYVAGDKKIMKFDLDGNKLAENDAMSSGVLGGGYTGWLAYGDGMIFVPSGDKLLAFNADDLSQLWIAETGIAAYQSSCPILYKDGYVYSGITVGTDNSGGYYCIKAEDEDQSTGYEVKKPTWKLEDSTGTGFYWAGAAIVENQLIVPCDNGYVYSINMTESIAKGEPVITDSFNADGTKTNIRTSIAYDESTKSIYYPTYQDKLYKVGMNTDGTFDKNAVQSIDINHETAQCPTIYNGRLYLGEYVYQADTLELIYKAQIDEDAQGSGRNGQTVVTAYATEENNQTVYVYNHAYGTDTISVLQDSTANNAENPGKVTKIKDGAGFNTCNTIIAPDGSLVFVNDTATLFCLKSTVTQEQVEAEKTYQGIIDKIEALPEADKVQLSDKANIEAVRTAYNALSAEN
ncbi:hypothetical protein KR505_12050 [Eubacterium callanderi]|uniref:hypothetical protein n=1 Tax=Eubacterium callanderi TaxID=53442 RepID=UPI001C2DB6CF|nr:hypothetical protein [Eubacterium callanderi]MBV1684132.1 hypothetical protein [Eubacterium callanderi]